MISLFYFLVYFKIACKMWTIFNSSKLNIIKIPFIVIFLKLWSQVINLCMINILTRYIDSIGAEYIDC